VRYIEAELYIRLKYAPTDDQLRNLNQAFRPLIEDGEIRRADPHPAEIVEEDRLGLPRLAFRFSRHHSADLRRLIDHLNGLSPQPAPSGSSN